MPFPELRIKFPNVVRLDVELGLLNDNSSSFPQWSSFDFMNCPGNIEHGRDIDYCRLGAEMDLLVEHFSEIHSTDNGTLTILINNTTEVHINADAQNLFFYSIWYVLLFSKCPVFTYNQWARSNYLPSTNPERMYYTLFSIFLAENYFVNSAAPPDLDKFKKEVKMLQMVSVNLLHRIRDGAGTVSDSVSNGMALFDTLLMYLLEMIDEGRTSVEERIKHTSVLARWE